MSFERQREACRISDDPARLDLDFVHGFLSTVYWSEGLPREVLERAIQHSLCFGLYEDAQQLGFARVVTDRATFAYLCDVFVTPSARGRGLGRWLINTLREHPDLQGLRRFLLVTKDAHGLYAPEGFKLSATPERIMEIVDPEVYRRGSAGT